MKTLRDQETKIILWNLPNDITLDMTPDFDGVLIVAGIDPYDMEKVSNLFRCNVTRVTETKESLHYKES